MATKPDPANARWSTDGTNETAPSSGQRDTGWTDQQTAISDYENILHHQAYNWFLYLDDGDLQGPHTFDDTVDIAGLLTASDGITVGANEHVTISGTGRYKHGDMKLLIPGSVAQAFGGSATYGTAAGWVVLSGADLFFPITLPVGARIKSFNLFANLTTTATKTVVFYRANSNGTRTDIDTLTTTADVGWASYSFDLTDTVTVDTSLYEINVSGWAVGDECWGGYVTYDFP